jgi:mono/diheme cytochrome c family protein
MVLKMTTFVLLLALTACSGTPATEPFEESGTEVEFTQEDARALYIIHCEACHGLDGKKGNSDAADLSVSTLDDAHIKSVILNGNDQGMMPFKELITSDKQVNGLVEYVKTLRK